MIYTVSQLNTEVKNLLESNLPLIQLEGEISNFMRAQSGHWYFSLKDQLSQIRCVMFKFKNQYTRYTIENGVQVIVRARLSVYEPRGEYQLLVESVKPAGIGDLQAQFEEMKARLKAEGLFANDKKRALPNVQLGGIKRLGVITSPSGAAIRDVLNVLNRRYPNTQVTIYPTQVQGSTAPAQICQAIEHANQNKQCDALLITRGGGSLEDLSCFNNEDVARAIANSALITVSAIGHDIDTTIADFVADASAPTPSAAAELLSPERTELAITLDRLEQRQIQFIQTLLNTHADSLKQHQLRLSQQHPRKQLEIKTERVNSLQKRLQKSLPPRLSAWKHQLHTAQLTLKQQHPTTLLNHAHQKLNAQEKALHARLKKALMVYNHRLSLLSRGLNAVSPLNTLARGYAITQTNNGHVITQASQTKPKQTLTIRYQDGDIKVTRNK